MPHWKRPILLACAAWTLLVAGAAGIAVMASHAGALEQARAAARVAFEKDLTFRRWNTMHGGVYVAVTDSAKPNPYLELRERDLTTTDGRQLTMINPAYMARQAYELQQLTAQVQGHITSLNPIRPANHPDDWEREALRRFEGGETEISSIEIINNKQYMRIMRPVHTEELCLKCHAQQGYKLGELRGGISVSVPMDATMAGFHEQAAKTVGGHALIWAIGMAGIVFGGSRLGHSIQQEKQARRDAETANLAKGEFLANMSHEIRTPLNGVLGMLQLLKEQNTPEERDSYVDMAYDSGNRLLGLLNDILDYSRVEAGELKIDRQPFRPLGLLDSAANVFRLACEKNRLDFVLKADPNLPEVLLGDEARLTQVLFNLLSNAVKFTAKGSVTLEAWARETNPGEVRLYLSVTDTGIGIPESKLDHVFERFTQVDASRTRRYEGAGLGLAIVKRLVQLMGGSMNVESELGLGTSFTMQVPLALPPDAVQPAPAQRPASSSTQEALRLLLVEDEEVSRLSAQVMLSRLGYEVVPAKNGQEAVEVFRAGGFHCVLMDIQMPIMNGLEATRAIREIEQAQGLPRTRIVALTAYAMPGDRETFLSSGMDDYVTKPVQPEALLLALRKVRLGAQPKPGQAQQGQSGADTGES